MSASDAASTETTALQVASIVGVIDGVLALAVGGWFGCLGLWAASYWGYPTSLLVYAGTGTAAAVGFAVAAVWLVTAARGRRGSVRLALWLGTVSSLLLMVDPVHGLLRTAFPSNPYMAPFLGFEIEEFLLALGTGVGPALMHALPLALYGATYAATARPRV